MQNNTSSPRPEKPHRQPRPKVEQVFAFLKEIDTCAAEDHELVRRLMGRLEAVHDEVVDDMRNDDEASHSQLIAWAIDADRLMRSRVLLESIDFD